MENKKEIPELKKAEKPAEKQTFTLLKQFKTDKKVYNRGDSFSSKDENVIKYLKTNKFI